MLTCVVPLTERGLFLAKGGASISSIHLSPDSPAALLLLLLASKLPSSNVCFPLLASQVDLQVWDIQNPSDAKHHSPIIVQIQDPTKYITQAQYPHSLQSLRGFSKKLFNTL